MQELINLSRFIRSYELGYQAETSTTEESNKGITLSAWTAYAEKHELSLDKADQLIGRITYKDVTTSLYEITEEQWMNFFKENYWEPCKADEIEDVDVLNVFVDWVWSYGEYAILTVQNLLGTERTGVVDSNLINEINITPNIFTLLKQARLTHIDRICDKNTTADRTTLEKRVINIHESELVLNTNVTIKTK